MREHYMESDSSTLDCFDIFDVKPVVGPSTSGVPEASTSRAILRENQPNGSKNPSNISTVYAELQKQGDRVLDLIKNQTQLLQHVGTSTKEQWASLTVQGNILKEQGETLKQQGDTLKQQGDTLKKQGDTLDKQGQTIVVKLLNDQQNLRDHVEQEFGRQGSILQQQETKLKVIEGRVDKLCKGVRDNGNPSNLRRSARLLASRIQQVPARGSQIKYQQVECNHCGKSLSSSYIRHHVPKCPVFRQRQQ